MGSKTLRVNWDPANTFLANEKPFPDGYEYIEKKITDKTKVILAVHLFGQSCEMDRIMRIAKQKGLYVIEDCAQAYLATYKGRLNGTIGHMGCFSLQDSKHIGTGDGGMLVTNDDRFAERAALFRDKCYFRDGRIRNPLFLAPNYRMTELQGAVALAQLKKLPWIVQKRRSYAKELTRELNSIPGVKAPFIIEGVEHSYYLYPIKIDDSVLSVSAREFAKALAAEGIPNHPNYEGMLVYADIIHAGALSSMKSVKAPGGHNLYHTIFGKTKNILPEDTQS